MELSEFQDRPSDCGSALIVTSAILEEACDTIYSLIDVCNWFYSALTLQEKCYTNSKVNEEKKGETHSSLHLLLQQLNQKNKQYVNQQRNQILKSAYRRDTVD